MLTEDISFVQIGWVVRNKKQETNQLSNYEKVFQNIKKKIFNLFYLHDDEDR